MNIKRSLATFMATAVVFAGTNFLTVEELKKSRDEVGELSDKVDSVSGDLSILKKDIDSKVTEIAELEDTLDKHIEYNNELESKVKDRNKKIKNLDSKVEGLSKDNSKLKSDLEAKLDREGKIKRESDSGTDSKIKSASNPSLVGKIKTESDSGASNVKQLSKSESKSNTSGRKLNVEATAYTARCTGCSGITATGVDVRNTIYNEGHRVIAVDPSVIPLHSLVEVSANGQTFTAVAKDTGGAIKGSRIDLLVGTKSDARSFGRRGATVTVIREGK